MPQLKREGVEWRRVQDEVVVLDLDGGRYLSVNRSGTVLWELLVEGASLARLEAELVHRFALDAGRARADVMAFLDWLEHQELLEPDAC